MFNFFKKNKGLEICAPMNGKIVDLSEVPDPVFAERMIGDGVAIIPTGDKVVAPCDGKVVQIFPTNHAIGFETAAGIDLLIHVGIDTVQLKGEGFKRLVEEGTEVKKGDALIEVDLAKLEAAGKPIITPILITNVDDVTIEERNLGVATACNTVVMRAKAKK